MDGRSRSKEGPTRPLLRPMISRSGSVRRAASEVHHLPATASASTGALAITRERARLQNEVLTGVSGRAACYTNAPIRRWAPRGSPARRVRPAGRACSRMDASRTESARRRALPPRQTRVSGHSDPDEGDRVAPAPADPIGAIVWSPKRSHVNRRRNRGCDRRRHRRSRARFDLAPKSAAARGPPDQDDGFREIPCATPVCPGGPVPPAPLEFATAGQRSRS